MNIQGFNKLTLLDFPGHTAAAVFFGGCPFRCPFCHNASLVRGPFPSSLDSEEIIAYLKKRRGLLEGVCISGGEALADVDLPLFLQDVKRLGYPIKLDTNGFYPERLKQLYKDRLLDYVAMDIKNDPLHYAETVGMVDFDLTPIQESLAFLKSADLPFECRTTVVANFHTCSSLVALARWIAPIKKYFLQAFEDSGDLLVGGLKGYDRATLEGFLREIQGIIPTAKLR